MMSMIFAATITGLVIGVSALIQFCFAFFQILFKKPLLPKGAVEIDAKEHIYAHPDYTDKLEDHRSFGAKTIYEAFLHGLSLGEDRRLFSFRESSNQSFKSYTYKEVFVIIKEIGSGVISFGLEPSNKTFTGIYGNASVNYALCLYSAWPYSMIPIGIYDSLDPDGVRFIMKQTDVKLIFVDNLRRVQNLIEWKDETLALKIIVSFIEPTDELIKLAEEKQLKLITLDKLREIGRNNLVEFVPPKPTDVGLIMYTSGSTGEPKGCVISHDSFLCATFGYIVIVDIRVTIKTKEIVRVLNYMPLAHMFGSVVAVAFTFIGGEIGFWQGQVDKLIDDFRDFRPTLLPMVPRLLNKLYDKVRLEMYKKGIFGRILFQLAVERKLSLIRRGIYSQNTIWDKILFNKIRQSFGGKVTRIITTSAPLLPHVGGFSRAAFSCVFVESYGQTECAIGLSQTVNDYEPGDTGIPLTMNYIKLVDVPEKECYAKDGVGEICIKSPAVFTGYLKDEIKTRDTIDEQGWLHTGDIGRWTQNKTMKIIDRKKHMYKLSQGEYVAPEKIEDVYGRSPFISQIFVYGDSFENYLIAIVVLNNDYIKTLASQNNNNIYTTTTFECSTQLKKIVLDDMIREGKKGNLISYEQVKIIEIINEPFTIESGLLTPTFKVRRYAIEKKYKQLFQNIYKSSNA